MSFYEDNLKALKIHKTELYNKLNNYDAAAANSCSIEALMLQSTKEEEKALIICAGGSEYRMNSMFRPSVEADRWSEQFELGGAERVITMFGLGNGIFAQKLTAKLSGNAAMLIYEPSAKLFFYVMENADLRVLINDDRVTIIVEDIDRLDFNDYLIQHVDFYKVETLLICCHPQYDRVFKASYELFIKTLADNRERIYVNKNTLARFKGKSISNTLANMHIMKEANLTQELENVIPKHIPAIIVSAGPSLDKNVELLREAKGRCFILAVDTAIKYLLNRGIIPDATIVVEPEKPVEHYADERSLDIPVICDIEANVEIVGRHRGRKIIFNCREFLKKLLENIGKKVSYDIGSGGSVATAAFALCYQLELEKIIFIGQDLAYSGETTHAGGIESKGINNNIGYEMIEGIDGESVRTRADWLGYLKWFENAITVLTDLRKDITVIDATEGGARIHGTEIMTLREVIDRYCISEYDFEKQLEKQPSFLNEEEYKRLCEQLKQCKAELEEMPAKAEAADKLCEEIIEVLQRQGSSANSRLHTSDKADETGLISKTYLKKCEQIKQIQAECEKCIVYPLVNNYAVSDVAEEIQKLSADSRDTIELEINRYKKMKLAFHVIPSACEDILRYMS